MEIYSHVGKYIIENWKPRFNAYADLNDKFTDDVADSLFATKNIRDWHDGAEVDFCRSGETIFGDFFAYTSPDDIFVDSFGIKHDGVTCLDVANYVKQFFSYGWLEENQIEKKINEWKKGTWLNDHILKCISTPRCFGLDASLYIVRIDEMEDFKRLEEFVRENFPKVDLDFEHDIRCRNFTAPCKVVLNLGEYAFLANYNEAIADIKNLNKMIEE